jgi:HEAT repeat protein
VRRALGAAVGVLLAAATLPGQPVTGPDSARVTRFLTALAAADPLICEMVSDQLGNFWFSDHELAIGRTADTRHGLRAAKDSLSRRVHDPAAIRVLSARLDADDPCVRNTAAKMLGNSAITDDALARHFDSPSPRVREAALRAAGMRSRPALRVRIERLLTAREGAVAAMAAFALGEIEQRASVPALRRALTHEGAQVRLTAAWALGNIEDVAAVPDLEGLVARDADRRVKHAAIHALGELQQRRSLDVLARVLEGRDLELATAAAEAIGELDDVETAPPALVRAIASPHRPLQLAAIWAAVEIDDPALAPVLLPHLRDEDPEIRVAVIEALAELQARIAIPGITRALNDPVADVRRAAVEALAEIEDK